MKTLVVLALSSVCGVALAAGDTTDTTPPVNPQQYTYGMKLDIARVISTTQVPNECGVVPMQMAYEDSAGQRHVLAYSVMGNGCSNG
ncbi:DUF2790 domain-containing protein [Pseudomonas sp. dw_358]|uniref:DUF2790 domain-containing protein n=1 Tax=Pseudomonas sp. dw_358 TaxID=2720083 RepID=UPI001BD243F8|nr:DUF2790 domain-containing protein [Pseudomonas sp. dw_358]